MRKVTECYPPLKLKAADLRIGDVVKVFDGAYGTATVTNIDKEGEIHLFRPYVTHSEFTTPNGVIPYIGIEQFSRPITDSGTFEVYRRWSEEDEEENLSFEAIRDYLDEVIPPMKLGED